MKSIFGYDYNYYEDDCEKQERDDYEYHKLYGKLNTFIINFLFEYNKNEKYNYDLYDFILLNHDVDVLEKTKYGDYYTHIKYYVNKKQKEYLNNIRLKKLKSI